MMRENGAPGLHDGETHILNLANKKLSDGDVFAFNYEGMVSIRRLHTECKTLVILGRQGRSATISAL
jgi:phage repressor protein C with HTH and peptisase S24 domain